MSIIALVIATTIPLFVLFFIYTRDLYGTGDYRFVITSFIWGGIAYLLASSVNGMVLNAGLADTLTVKQFTAPVAEEIIKPLFLIYLVRRPQFTYFVDGAIYGFAIGMGFAVFENYEYILNNESVALAVAIGRVISTNLIHAAASAIVGIAFGLSRFERSIGRARILLLGLILAMVLHVGFNNLVTRVSSEWLIIYAAGVGFASLGVIWAAIQRGLEDEKAWIKETLGDADRVTAGEAAAVQNLSKIEQILAPLAKRFGAKKASRIERFLMLQARLGIMRKTLDKLPDKKLLDSVEAEMDKIRAEMDDARREVGTYAMMYLRTIYPMDDDVLWGHFEDVISQRIAEHPAGAGGGLWSNLDKQTGESSQPSSVE